MRISILALAMMCFLEMGCVSLSVSGAFSPVQGPLSRQSPVPAYTAKMSGLMSGTISVTLDNGEVCSGPWFFVSKTPPNAPEPVDMAADWDSVYGRGFYVAHVVGNKLYARATLIGNMGTTVHAEMSNETNTRGNTRGVARDNNGNVFKVSVYN